MDDALATSWQLSRPGSRLVGLGWTNVAYTTMRQELTPDELLGRVMATTRTLYWLLIPIGATMSGFIAGEVGLVPVCVTGVRPGSRYSRDSRTETPGRAPIQSIRTDRQHDPALPTDDEPGDRSRE